jgi:hypothetical protein
MQPRPVIALQAEFASEALKVLTAAETHDPDNAKPVNGPALNECVRGVTQARARP